MKDVLKYKDFLGSAHFSTDDDIFYGKIQGITDLVTFEGKSVKELKKSFNEAVEDYLELCQQAGKKPFKTFRGSFNVRISPKLHMSLFHKATEKGVPLNKLVQEALEKEIKRSA